MELHGAHFIGEPIEVEFGERRGFEKRPHCPIAFAWRDRRYEIGLQLSEWHDYARRGHAAHNMRPAHLTAAAKKGSWGVGRDYFRVQTTEGQRFDLYYDRAPSGSSNRKGSWWLYRELAGTPSTPAQDLCSPRSAPGR